MWSELSSVAFRPRTLSVCSGVGALDLGLRMACGARTVCYVEREGYAAGILVDRMEEEALDIAPVWDDLATFDGRPWRGSVDLIAGGIPCQPYSVAGKREGNDDERALWPEIVRLAKETECGLVFLEEVPPFLAQCEPLWSELRDLGFEWCPPYHATAAHFGAPHDRHRVFLLAAHPDRFDLWEQQGRLQPGRESQAKLGWTGQEVALATCVGRGEGRPEHEREQGGPHAPELRAPNADPDGLRCLEREQDAPPRGRESNPQGLRQQATDTDHSGFHGERCGWVFDVERQTLRYDPHGCGPRCSVHGSFWEAESPPVRVDAGAASWVDEIRTIGNVGAPPLVYAAAFLRLLNAAL